MSTNDCRVCGSPVRLEQRTMPRRLGAEGTTTEVRKCTDPACSTNSPSRRRLGEAP